MAKKTSEFVPEDYNQKDFVVADQVEDETTQEKDARINREIEADKAVDVVPTEGTLPERIVHDDHGNVRPEVMDLGVGTVTVDDVVKSGRFEFRKREDGVYDIYNLDGGLVVVGASYDDLENYK